MKFMVSRRKLSDGSILFNQVYETTDTRMSFASVAPLHVCYCNFSLVPGIVGVDVGRPLLPICRVFISWKHHNLLDIFVCGLSRR